MRLRIRLLWLIISRIFRSRLSILDEATVDLRVHINDVDIRKVSGDRYFALADLGWGNLFIRWGAFARVLKGECAPVGQVLALKVRKPLWLFQRFQIRVKVLWWDERWVYLEERFVRNGETVACLMGKAGLLKGNTLININDWVPGARTATKPDKPPQVEAIEQFEAAIQW